MKKWKLLKLVNLLRFFYYFLVNFCFLLPFPPPSHTAFRRQLGHGLRQASGRRDDRASRDPVQQRGATDELRVLQLLREERAHHVVRHFTRRDGGFPRAVAAPQRSTWLKAAYRARKIRFRPGRRIKL